MVSDLLRHVKFVLKPNLINQKYYLVTVWDIGNNPIISICQLCGYSFKVAFGKNAKYLGLNSPFWPKYCDMKTFVVKSCACH